MSSLEVRLREAMHAVGGPTRPSPDLFARVMDSVAADTDRRRRRRRLAVAGGAGLGAVAVASAIIADRGGMTMPWWVLETVTAVVLVTLVVVLGPFIKRFGRSYAAEVFRATPTTGASFVVLVDVAYYLIFSAYVLFTVSLNRPSGWTADVGAVQVRDEVLKVGGLLLLLGALHAVNLLVLPVIGRLLTLNRQLDEQLSREEGR